MATCRKIALEEHFLCPGFEDYWKATVADVDPDILAGLTGRLFDLGAQRLDAMDRVGIARAVLSPRSSATRRRREARQAALRLHPRQHCGDHVGHVLGQRHRPRRDRPRCLAACHRRVGAEFLPEALSVLDEPSAGLNRQEKEDIARYLLRVRHDFAPTIVWIEHDMQLVRDLADKVFVLHYGRQLASGAPLDVLADPRVVEAYIGTG